MSRAPRMSVYILYIYALLMFSSFQLLTCPLLRSTLSTQRSRSNDTTSKLSRGIYRYWKNNDFPPRSQENFRAKFLTRYRPLITIYYSKFQISYFFLVLGSAIGEKRNRRVDTTNGKICDGRALEYPERVTQPSTSILPLEGSWEWKWMGKAWPRVGIEAWHERRVAWNRIHERPVIPISEWNINATLQTFSINYSQISRTASHKHLPSTLNNISRMRYRTYNSYTRCIHRCIIYALRERIF